FIPAHQDRVDESLPSIEESSTGHVEQQEASQRSERQSHPHAFEGALAPNRLLRQDASHRDGFSSKGTIDVGFPLGVAVVVVYPGMQAALILMHEQGAQMAGAPSQEQLLMNFDVAGVWDIRRQSFESSQPMLEQPQIP